MKRIIAIVAGGDSSEHDVSMRSAEGIYSFIDKDKYTLYIVELTKKKWEALLPDGSRAPIDKNDFSFSHDGQKVKPDFAYITIHGTPGEMVFCKAISNCWVSPTLLATCWFRP